nr:nucleolin-like isoform X2 [Rhipicephalus microplus]
MKLKKAQGATGEKSPKNDKEKKLHKANDNDEEVESDTADYLKVSTSPNKKPKVPAPEADSEEDDLEVDDEDDEDDDELDEESPEDEELDDSEGFSDEDDHEVPQLVAAGKAKAKKKPAPKKAALEEGSEDEEDDEEDDSDSDDEEEDDDDDDDGDEDDDEEEDMVKMKKVVKAEQAKRKATDDGPTEQTSKKAKQGDGIPRSLLMDVDEYDKLFLYVGNLPKGCTVEEVKDLSPDIVSVRTNVKLGEKLSFAFVEFKSEADADRNFKRLQKASLRGHPLRVGYRGAKRADLPSNWQELHFGDIREQGCIAGCPQEQRMSFHGWESTQVLLPFEACWGREEEEDQKEEVEAEAAADRAWKVVKFQAWQKQSRNVRIKEKHSARKKAICKTDRESCTGKDIQG